MSTGSEAPDLPRRKGRPCGAWGSRWPGERHVVAAVDERDQVLLKPTPFTEDAEGDQTLFDRLGPPADTLIAMEATGHYWKNLFATLVAHGVAVALLNPLRTRRFAGEALQRTQTDAIDALGSARFAAQKRPPPT